MSPTDYASYAEALKGSASLRRDEISRCTAGVRSTPQQKVLMAKVMNLPEGSDPIPVACKRLTEAVASGQLSYDDYRQVRSSTVTPETIRILQSR